MGPPTYQELPRTTSITSFLPRSRPLQVEQKRGKLNIVGLRDFVQRGLNVRLLRPDSYAMPWVISVPPSSITHYCWWEYRRQCSTNGTTDWFVFQARYRQYFEEDPDLAGGDAMIPMETQVLMQEVLTDGMAFCSIM